MYNDVYPFSLFGDSFWSGCKEIEYLAIDDRQDKEEIVFLEKASFILWWKDLLGEISIIFPFLVLLSTLNSIQMIFFVGG